MREFVWRDRKGNFHKVSEMTTRHLFFTLRMIYNHSVPERKRLTPYVHYSSFDSFYTKEYLKAAIMNISLELYSRNDIEKEWADQILQMGVHLSLYKSNPELEKKQ